MLILLFLNKLYSFFDDFRYNVSSYISSDFSFFPIYKNTLIFFLLSNKKLCSFSSNKNEAVENEPIYPKTSYLNPKYKAVIAASEEP